MRRLAILSFSFAAGAAAVVLGTTDFYLWLLSAAILSAGILAAVFCKKHRALALLILIGVLAGLLWSRFRREQLIDIPTAEVCEDTLLAVELTDYPTRGEYGYSGTGLIRTDSGVRKVSFYAAMEEKELCPGDILVGLGSLSELDGQEQSYYRSIGVSLFAYLKTPKIAAVSERGSIRYFPARLAHRVKAAVYRLLPEDTAPVLTALLLGDRSGLTYRDKSDLQLSGIYHALAVSGMHVSILMGVISALTLKNRRLYLLLGAPVLLIYCLVTGMPASVIRAAIMQLFLMAAPAFGRESDSPTSLGAALLVLTVQNPWALLNTGLQISFLSTAGILCLGSRFHKIGERWHPKSRVLRGIWNYVNLNISQSLSALLFSTPLLVLQFGRIAVLGVVTNLLTIQAITWSFSLGLLLSLLALAGLPAGILAAVITLLLRYTMFAAGTIADLPFAVYYPASLWFWVAAAAMYALFACLLFPTRLRRLWKLAGLLAALAVCVCVIVESIGRNRAFSCTVLDVGQGQCVLLESHGMSLAVDCGGSYGNQAGESLNTLLRKNGHAALDFLVLTHYDTDHTGGVERLLQSIPVTYLLLPDVPDSTGNRAELEAAAAESGAGVYYVRQDLLLEIGAGSVCVTAPLSTEGGNASCLTVYSDYTGYNVLITGDLSRKMEQLLVERYDFTGTELLVAGHHGSASSTSEELLAEVRPEVVVISVGENNYGHPNQDTINRIKKYGAELYRTDEDGTVTVRR